MLLRWIILLAIMSSPPSNASCETSPSQTRHTWDEVQDTEGSPVVPSSDRAESNLDIALRRAKPAWRRHLASVGWLVADQWFLISLGFLVLVSSQVQVPRSQQDLKALATTYLCVALIFLITGCTLPTKVLLSNYRRWRVHIFVQVQSFLVTSAVVFGVVALCATNRTFMDPGLLIGLIVMGCITTTVSSNVVMTKKADGNQALAVVQSTLGNFLGPFFSPLLIDMYLSSGAWYTDVLPVPSSYGALYRRVFKQLGLSVFLPLVCSTRFGSSKIGLTSDVGCGPNHPECLSKDNEASTYGLGTQ